MSKFSPNTGWRDFLKLCLRAESPQKLDQLFQLVLTAEERDDLATRTLIIRELLNGKMTQREMAETLGVSIAKITRGSNALKTMDKEFIRCLLN